MGATLIDNLLLVPIAIIVFARSGDLGSSDLAGNVHNRSLLIIYGVNFVYELVFIALLGQTVGDMATGIKVVGQSGLGLPGFTRSLARIGTILLASSVPLVGPYLAMLCYLWIFWDPRRQGLHDKVARTLVIDLRPARHRTT